MGLNWQWAQQGDAVGVAGGWRSQVQLWGNTAVMGQANRHSRAVRIKMAGSEGETVGKQG